MTSEGYVKRPMWDTPGVPPARNTDHEQTRAAAYVQRTQPDHADLLLAALGLDC